MRDSTRHYDSCSGRAPYRPSLRLGCSGRAEFTRCGGYRPFFSALMYLACAATLFTALGCDQPPAVNPWRDDSIPSSAWTTPSSDGIMAANHPAATRPVSGDEIDMPHVSNDSPHYPLWWEDPFEDKGDLDHNFAWTWQDYLAMGYSPGRWVLNSLAWPVSAVVTLPGTPMVSDGVVGRDHDAKPGTTPNPTGETVDFGISQEVPAPEIVDSPATQPNP